MKSKASFIIYLFILLTIVGCKANKEKENFKKKDNAPDSLNELSKSFDEIFETIDTIEKIQLGLTVDIEKSKNEKDSNSQEKEAEDGNKDSSKEASNTASDNKDKAKENTSGSSSEAKTEVSKDEKLKLAWKKIDEVLEKAHGKWNDFEVDGIKKGITREKSEKFQTSFNKMTKSVEDRTIVDIYDFGSQSVMNLKPFYDLYLDDIGGEVSVLKYVAYQSYIRAVSDNINGALSLFNHVEGAINNIRIKIGDKEEKIKELNKANNSLLDMKLALEEQSKKLFMIKKEMIIKNLKELE